MKDAVRLSASRLSKRKGKIRLNFFVEKGYATFELDFLIASFYKCGFRFLCRVHDRHVVAG